MAGIAVELSTTLVLQLAAGLRRRDAWEPLLGVVGAAQAASADLRPAADLLGFTCTVTRLDTLVAAGRRENAAALARSLLDSSPREVRDLLVQLAATHGLEGARSVLVG
jgi:hypothetical protein